MNVTISLTLMLEIAGFLTVIKEGHTITNIEDQAAQLLEKFGAVLPTEQAVD